MARVDLRAMAMRSLGLLAMALALVAPGCATEIGDEDLEEELEQTESAATSCRRAEPTIKIVSANIFEGGVWDDTGKRQRNWATMERFIKLVKDIDAPVLAVQETVSAESANRLLTRLNQVTGKAWSKQDTVGVNPWGIATAIYWRNDVVQLDKSLGHHDLGKLDSNGYTIRFHGVMLEKKGTGKRFAVFTGKLPWTNGAENYRMAPELRDWVRTATAAYPNAVRVIAMDMNAPLGSPTWKLFAADYDDSGAKLGTHPSDGIFPLRKRLDYIWADRGAGPKEGCAFLEPVRRSMHFGSDHRFVWGDVYLR
jgi:hypothetical protein